ncbi:MAG: glycosyltransferase family 4 protein [Anaerolineae bacterium]
MKIAYLSSDSGIPLFGNKGASVHIRELVNALSALGHQVTILAASRGAMSCPLRAEVIEVGAEPSPLTTEAFPNVGQERALAKMQRSLRICSAILERLVTLHAQEGFDLMYERYSLWSAAGVRAAHELKIPCLVEVNAPLLDEQRRYREMVLASEAEAIEAEVFDGADALLAVSEQVKAYALAKGAHPERTFVVPNGVDVKRFHPAVEAEPLEGADGKFVLGFVGSLKVWHGMQVLMEAFRTLLGRLPAYHLLLVGDGPLRSWIEGYIQGARLEGMVTIMGSVPYDRLPSLIQRMDVAVAPYPFVEDFYFSPLKLFEYMAIGKPVVASRIGQIQEVIQDGATGLLVRPGDPRDLVEKIERLRDAPGLREALGTAASQEAGHYTWERNARRVIALADQMVKKG